MSVRTPRQLRPEPECGRHSAEPSPVRPRPCGRLPSHEPQPRSTTDRPLFRFVPSRAPSLGHRRNPPLRPPPSPSPQLQCAETQEGQQNRDDPKPHDDLGLFPALHLKMMMDGCHQKNTFPARLERGYLKDD